MSKKVSALTAMLGSEIDLDNDYFPIIDISEPSDSNKNKRISPREFLRLAAQLTGFVTLIETPYNASGNTLPSTGGTGSGGAILSGNTFVVSVGGVAVNFGGSVGVQSVPVGSWLVATVDNPTANGTDWRLL